MYRNRHRIFLLTISFPFLVDAASVVDCRVVTGGITECNPYPSKMIRAKEITYDKDSKKLIVDKTLPLPKKKEKMKVVSVADMIEKYVKVQEPLRYKGSMPSPYSPHPKRSLRKQAITEASMPAKKEKRVEKKNVPSKSAKSPINEQPQKQPEENYGLYRVEHGDTLSKIAHQFNTSTKALMKLNHWKKKDLLKVGQSLKIPMSQEELEIYKSGEYPVKPGDTLISIAKKFGLDPKAVASFNHISSGSMIRAGKKIKLPLPYFVKKAKKEAARQKRIAEKKKRHRIRMLKPFGRHKLRVTATAYSSHRGQTDSTPFLAAWNNRIRPGMKIIAVSRDLLTRYGLRNGSRVKIGGLPGYYRVRDKMNKRFKKRIDIYMGTNRRRALRWGKRSVVIYW
jgi:LysM repeat protein/3D (Asp-Asp-Asp) domain-containing protein